MSEVLPNTAIVDLAAPVCDVSVVIPCLDEEATIAVCVEKAWEGLRRADRSGEVIVVDNGSTDGSAALARAAGARVVDEPRRGYGRAYRTGFAAAHGNIIVMGDGDDTYDFTILPELLAPIEDGYEMVLGSRFAGQIQAGAMPWLHRYVGNPVLTGMLNRMFGLNSSDAHSGLRAFTRGALERLELRSDGMELASELVVNTARSGLRVTEIPIVYHPRLGESKLQSLRDGWRHVRYLLLHAPRWLFMLPGLALFFVGLVGQLLLLPGTIEVAGRTLLSHWSIVAALITVLGSQAVAFGAAGLVWVGDDGPAGRWLRHRFRLETGLLAGTGMFAVGFAVDAAILVQWLQSGMDELEAIRPALLALSLMVIGVQVILASFFTGMLLSGPAPAGDTTGEAGNGRRGAAARRDA